MREDIQFTNISIVGRVYFGIKSLENSLGENRRINDNWKWVLDVLWSYCENSVKKGNWHRIMSEICPDAVLEEVSFESKDVMTVSRSYYEKLQLLYSNTPSHINKIIEYIFDIGTIDLYGSIRDDSPITKEYCEELFTLLITNNIEIPEVNFLYGTIKDNRGWGFPITRDGYIKYGEEDIKSPPPLA